MSDTYLTINGESLGEFKDRGSKFLAYAYPASNEEEWQSALAVVKKLHPKARHFCFAYRLGITGDLFRANDDGEPSGTAGRPILGQIDSLDLVNVIVIVVRYFGGTKLGTSGLIKAYKESTAEALKSANIVSKLIEEFVQLEFGYELMSDIMNAVKKMAPRIVKQEFEASGLIIMAFPKSELENSLIRFKAYVRKISLEEAKTIEKIDGLEMTIL